LVQIGAYAPGSDPVLDEAIALQPGMIQFLQQDMQEAAPMEQALAELALSTSVEALP
jgi:flagellum-specific ATP synthase